MAELKEHVNTAWAAMTPSFIKRVTRRLGSTLERIVAAEVGHMEKLIKYCFFYVNFTSFFLENIFVRYTCFQQTTNFGFFISTHQVTLHTLYVKGEEGCYTPFLYH